jgi:hypothetical protein
MALTERIQSGPLLSIPGPSTPPDKLNSSPALLAFTFDQWIRFQDYD